MPGQREIRYIGVAWQVMSLPDGTREIAFNDPDERTLHVLPLPKGMAEAMAAQLRGDEESRVVVPDAPAEPPPEPLEPLQGPSGSIMPWEPYPPEHRS